MTRPIEITAETLGGVKILSGLDRDARAKLARRCHGWRYEPQHEILHHLDSSKDVYLIISGRVRVTIFSRSGKEVAFRDMSPGETFGDLSAIDGEPRSASVVTLQDCVIVSMSPEVFWATVREHPQVAEALMRELAELVRRLSERVVEFSTLGVNNRIHAELLRLAREATSDGRTAVISPAPTHAEIASRVSSHREAVTRELRRLAREGLVSKEGRALNVADLPRLARMVDDVKNA